MNTSPSLSPPRSDLDRLVEKRSEIFARMHRSPSFQTLATATLWSAEAASTLLSERALRERVEGERNEAIRLMSQYARDLGEMEGRYKAAHWPGIVDDWQARAQASEAHSSQLEAELKRRDEDARRMDWLERHTVNVRIPLVHGSADLFWATPDDSFEGEDGPSDLRAKIDAALQPQEGGDA